MSESLAFLIDAPMQSWGVASRFQYRDTSSWPTKSALVGLLAAAGGIDKYSPDEASQLAPLLALDFSVYLWRKPSATSRLNDFHTIGGGYDKNKPSERPFLPVKAGDRSPFGTVITNRAYLNDARFIAIFQGCGDTLGNCVRWLEDPVWGVWFGRKTCLPASPLAPVLADSPVSAVRGLLEKFGVDATGLTMEGQSETTGEGEFYQSDLPVAFGAHHGPVPTAYHSRPVRHVRLEVP